MGQFRRALAGRWGVALEDYEALHAFSVQEPARFYRSLWDFAQLLAEEAPGPDEDKDILVPAGHMKDTRYFPHVRLNFAENMIARCPEVAMIFRDESERERMVGRSQMCATVARVQQRLRHWGVGPGDRVAGVLPNCPEAVMVMLAVTALGAVWTSCSPDFGLAGLQDRLQQARPRVLFGVDGTSYKGRAHSTFAKLTELAQALPGVEHTVVLPFLRTPDPHMADLPNFFADDEPLTCWGAEGDTDPPALHFERTPFDHPLFILYSSGTTGKPKCITHRAGGVLLNLIKEHRLHAEVMPGEKLFFFTTLGWMMWNWLVGGMASGATLVLYDGAPAQPPETLFRLAEEHSIEHLGVSAKFIDAIAQSGYTPSYAFPKLRSILSTGSPLMPPAFDFVYAHIKQDVRLASISGGTDILGCFVGAVPERAVRRGEIQGPLLGMAVDVYTDEGTPAAVGEFGDLVCTHSFPHMPLDGAGLLAGYFERFPKVWQQGDFMAKTAHGGYVIEGRSDATLNPGGVRIGTAEIYAQAESHPAVVEAIAVGQAWQRDVRVVLFVRLCEGHTLNGQLCEELRTRIRTHCSPHHVPAKILEVADIPRTLSGKLTELAVRDVIHDRPVHNRDALANPEALEYFRHRKELQG